MNEKINVLLIANGAGELAAYVKPVAKKIFEEIPNADIILILSPCQYATGFEAKYALGLGTISQIVDADSFKRWLLINKAPANLNLSRKGVIVYLGGEIMYAALLAKKINLPAFAYLGGHAGWDKHFKKFYVSNQADFNLHKAKVSEGKLVNIGNLMVDSVSDSGSIGSSERKLKVCQKLMLNPKQPIVSLFPGSRDFSLDYLIPFYAKVLIT